MEKIGAAGDEGDAQQAQGDAQQAAGDKVTHNDLHRGRGMRLFSNFRTSRVSHLFSPGGFEPGSADPDREPCC